MTQRMPKVGEIWTSPETSQIKVLFIHNNYIIFESDYGVIFSKTKEWFCRFYNPPAKEYWIVKPKYSGDRYLATYEQDVRTFSWWNDKYEDNNEVIHVKEV